VLEFRAAMRSRTAFGQRTLPGEYFTSEEVFRAEREQIFHRSWLLAGHVSELASPGSFFLFERDRERVVVLRDDRDGAGEACLNGAPAAVHGRA
jgi:phenylpropionate dioxygenase-like ring-hydroxylating dioxygenase large terminal subunit